MIEPNILPQKHVVDLCWEARVLMNEIYGFHGLMLDLETT